MMKPTRARLFGTTVILAVYVLLAGASAQKRALSPDQVTVLHYAAEAKIYTDSKDQPDFGQKVKVLLKNRGVPATITVSVILSCSEGRWKKQASTELENNETGYVYVDFPEPSIACEDIDISKVEVVGVR